MNKQQSFTGVGRDKSSKVHVKLIDALAQGIVTVGGFGTIAAVLLVCVYLAYVSLPLFDEGHVDDPVLHEINPEATIAAKSDEYRRLYYAINEQGDIILRKMTDGTELMRKPVFADKTVTAWSIDPLDPLAAAGFDDGTVTYGQFGFVYSFIDVDAMPGLAAMQKDDIIYLEDGLVECTGRSQYRRTTLRWSFVDPVETDTDQPVTRLAHIAEVERDKKDELGNYRLVKLRAAACHSDLQLTNLQVTYREVNDTYRVRTGHINLAERIDALPDHLFVTGLGDNAFLLWSDGTLLRYKIRSYRKIELSESIKTLPEGRVVTAASWVNGRNTLLIGSDKGDVHAWFRCRPENPTTNDGEVMIEGHVYDIGEPGGAAAKVMVGSSRSRLVVMVDQAGQLEVRNATTTAVVAEATLPAGTTVDHITIAPKEDAIFIMGGGKAGMAAMNPEHHEVTVAAISLPVHYEGYPEPMHMWQSTGGDAGEPKLGLWPLVFGTLKGTLISMFFAVPVALLAAIYTSEFMHKRVKATVKPAIEMMASLPSVILGFLAAAYFAVIFEDNLTGIVTSIYLVPFAFMLGAQIWQLIPRSITGRMVMAKMPIILLLLLLTPMLATLLTPTINHLLFRVGYADGSDTVFSMITWLNAGVGVTPETVPAAAGFGGIAPVTLGASESLTSPFGGWFIGLLPVVAVGLFALYSALIKPRLMVKTSDWETPRLAVLSLGTFLICTLATLLLTAVLALVVSFVGDLRSFLFGTFQQRNALVVGFVMGFAVIPIIYTIAEDALSAVPDALRMASLGSGATPWQTAVRIVLPTAMSGVFSAIMVGLGRCVGETMIVLMATGNTPVMTMSLFEGFRTLSANIAVELPEAVRDHAHYRLLFLSGLVLFAMTFVFNTIAEAVRQRFRKKAMQL